MQSRRVFLGSAAMVGVGSAAGGSFLLNRESNAQGHAGHGRDPVFAELGKQIQESVEGLRQRPAGEHARKLASAMRIAAAHGAGVGIDAQVKAALRDAIRKEGRDALLLREVDPARLAQEAKQFGLAQLPPQPPVDFAARGQVLDALLSEGVTAQWRKAADAFDRISEELDRRAGGIRTVALQSGSISCAEMWWTVTAFNSGMTFFCNPVTIWMPWWSDMCVVMFGGWVGAWLAANLYC